MHAAGPLSYLREERKAATRSWGSTPVTHHAVVVYSRGRAAECGTETGFGPFPVIREANDEAQTSGKRCGRAYLYPGSRRRRRGLPVHHRFR
nr:hypothetical protein SHINE37_40348 [Rhizobiaceae bacterium]